MKVLNKIRRGLLRGTGTKSFRHKNDRRMGTRATKNRAALNHAS